MNVCIFPSFKTYLSEYNIEEKEFFEMFPELKEHILIDKIDTLEKGTECTIPERAFKWMN